MKFQCAIVCNKGGRVVNEDYADFLTSEHSGCWAVADGLGGHGAGETAAEIAVKSVISDFDGGVPDLAMLMMNAHQAVQLAQSQKLEYRHMRTTLAVLVCHDGIASWAHAGDSRVYHFRDRCLNIQTKDHSVCQALVNAGEICFEEIRGHADRNRLYRVLGSEGKIKFSLQSPPLHVKEGDAFLMCTDGFWELVTEQEMEEALTRSHHPAKWLEEMEQLLKRRATPRHDNYSAIAIFI
ncbi:MAG TPA: protein phosphatase 2C domain-containing protein [Chondromyces sp.]|nr:protein phosphatase 2C domain-containing protein [Chondromyces sp.]